MPDGPMIGAEEALALLRESGHGNSPDHQFARRGLAGKFCELFDPNLPVADFDGNVTRGGVVVVPAATVDQAVDKGYLPLTGELRAAVLRRDERIKDVERNARAEMLTDAHKDIEGELDEDVIAEAREKAKRDTAGLPPDERAENARPPHEASGPAPKDVAIAGTDEDHREELFEEYEKANEAAIKAEKEGVEGGGEHVIMTRVPLSAREELEQKHSFAAGLKAADEKKSGAKAPAKTKAKAEEDKD